MDPFTVEYVAAEIEKIIAECEDFRVPDRTGRIITADLLRDLIAELKGAVAEPEPAPAARGKGAPAPLPNVRPNLAPAGAAP